MNSSLPRHPQPDWLSTITQENIKETFSLENVLRDSLFYPGSGLDPMAIRLFAGHVSFVYADFGVDESTLTRWVNDIPMESVTPIEGYDLVASMNVEDHQLSPGFCWDHGNRKLDRHSQRAENLLQRYRALAGSPIFRENNFKTPQSTRRILETDVEGWFFHLERVQEIFSSAPEFLAKRWNYLREKAELLSRQFESPHTVLEPYARYFVLGKNEEAPEDAPDRIALMFLGEEGSMVYRHLYAARGIAPDILLIHNVKNFEGDNRNWSAPDPVKSSLHEAVMGASSLPKILAWKLYQEPCSWADWEEVSSVPTRMQFQGDKPIQLLRPVATPEVSLNSSL